MCVLNFCTLASYAVDLVARQPLALALEWTSLREEEDGEGGPVLAHIYSQKLVLASLL